MKTPGGNVSASGVSFTNVGRDLEGGHNHALETNAVEGGNLDLHEGGRV